MTLRVQLLGRFEVTRDGVPVGPGPESVKPRAVLALLALRANEVVSKEALIDELWPQPPASARNLVEKYVSLWRKVLDADRVQTLGSGYRLRLDASESDLLELGHRLEQGRRLVRDGRHTDAAALFAAAFPLWHGSDVEHAAVEVLPAAEAQHLVELQLGHLELWAGAALAAATPLDDDLIVLLRRACERHPLRERLGELLMWALYRTGEQAEAVAVHRRVRAALARDLGQHPGAALDAMLGRVLRGDPVLTPPDRPQAAATSPRVVPNLPPRSHRFVGRGAELAELARVFGAAAGLDAPSAVAIWGGAGTGKTALALEYAHRERERYDLVWYLNAASRTSVDDGLEALGRRLGLAPSDRTENRHLLWDALARNGSWLLIYDDAASPAALAEHWPTAAGGHVVVTTTDPGWGLRAHLLEVPVLSPSETLRLLGSRTGRSVDTEADAELARELDGLPLACEQAAAYMRQTGMTAADYLPFFRRRRAELLERGSPDGHRRTIGTTWRLALAELSQDAPDAVGLLLLCAQLAPEDVPMGLLRAAPDVLPEPLGRILQDDIGREDLIGWVRRYALLRRTGDRLQMHRLLQAVVTASLPASEAARWRRRALRLLVAYAPASGLDETTWASWQSLVPHVVAAAAALDPATEIVPGLVDLLHRTAEYLVVRGSGEDAGALLERTLAVVRAGGRGDEEIAATLVLLGEAVERTDRAGRALECFEQALGLLQASDPDDHPWAARAQSGLSRVFTCYDGATRWKPADLPRVEESFVRSLAVLEVRLGADHPVVARSLAGLGQIRQDRGDIAGAVECHERALSILERACGADHPEVGHTLDKLGYALRLLGDAERAGQCHERAYTVLAEAFGEGHVETGWPLCNLGVLLLDLGRPQDAVDAQTRAHAVFRAAMGPAAVPTLLVRWRLALAQLAAGNPGEAEETLRDTVPRLEAALGDGHPDVVHAREDWLRCRVIAADDVRAAVPAAAGHAASATER